MADCQHWIEPMRAQEISELEAERKELVNNIRIAQAALTELRSIINHADATLGRAVEHRENPFGATYNDMALRQLGRMAGSPLAQQFLQSQRAAASERRHGGCMSMFDVFNGLFGNSLT